MSAARTQWLIAQRMRVPRSSPKVTLHVGKVVTVGTGVASIYLNGNEEEAIADVEIAPGLTLTAGQVVDVTFTGDAPLITARRT